MSATQLLFRDDAYARACEAGVLSVTADGVILDCTVFYAQGGGQPGDVGALVTANGDRIEITNTVYGADRTQVAHLVGTEAASRLAQGETVTVQLDWPR